MTQAMENILGSAEEGVRRLVQECRPTGPLYTCNPRKVAQVSRTGKWLLNAIAALQRELNSIPYEDPEP